MKIAIPTKNNVVDDHFGHCEYFTVLTIENSKVVEQDKIESDKTCGCKSEIVPMLKGQGVETMLVGNLGQGAINKITNAGIKLIRGCSGDVTTLVNNFIAGKVYDSITVCHEHSNGSAHGHQCAH